MRPGIEATIMYLPYCAAEPGSKLVGRRALQLAPLRHCHHPAGEEQDRAYMTGTDRQTQRRVTSKGCRKLLGRASSSVIICLTPLLGGCPPGGGAMPARWDSRVTRSWLARWKEVWALSER